MRLLVGNVVTQVVIGGKDNLLDFDVKKELDKYLSVSVPGAFFACKKSGNKWDGKKHFLVGDKFPTGFLPDVLKFCAAKGISTVMDDIRNNKVTFKKEFQHQIGEDELRDYQIELAKNTINNKLETIDFPRGIVNAATNSGKTVLMAGIIANIENPKVLFIIHSADIYEDAVEYFSKFFKVGQINSKHYDIQDVTVAMVKSLYLKAKKSLNVYNDLKRFNTILVDEAHRAGGAEYSTILQHIDAYVRIFLSGTALKNSEKLKNLYVVAGSGKVLCTIRNSEMIEKGVSRAPLVYIHKVVHKSKKICFSYEEEKEYFLNASEERADKVREIMLSNPELNTMVAFQNYEAGERVFEKIKDLDTCDLVDGSPENKKTRRVRIQAFGAGKIKNLVLSMIGKEGLNLPNIQRLIMYVGGKSDITILQFVGRALRAKQGESTVEVHDFMDGDGEYLAKHSRKRIQMYLNEGFSVKEVGYNSEGKMVVLKEYKPKKIKTA